MLEGSQAGTALRASFIRLAKPTKASQKAMDELGVSLTNSKGQFVGMPNLIGQFKSSLQGMTKEQKLAYVSQIVGTEAASGFLALIDAGPNKIKKYSDSLKDSNGASKEAADKMKDNLKGSLEQLHGAFESLGITIGKAFSPVLRKLADVVTAVVSKFSSLPTPVIVITTLFVGLVASIGPLLMLTGLLAHSIVGISEAMTLLNGTKGGAKFFSLFNDGIKGVLPKIGQLLTKIPLIGGLMTSLAGPVGIAVAAIAGIGTAFVIAYKKSETFRNIVNSVIDPVINSFKKMWNVVKSIFNAMKQLLSGNFLPTLDLLSKIMPKETATKLTMRLLQIRQLFVDAFNSIFDFVKEIGKKLTDFWTENGDTVIQALKNIGNFFVDFFVYLKDLIGPNLRDLGNLVQSIFMNVLVPVIKGAMNIILGIMKFVWPFIKILVVDTWNNIKNIIRAALDVILGIVKIFSGIFTGQWKLVWEGVKQVFKGALVLIWNLIQLWFIGKILKVVKIFGGFFKSVISKSFNGVKTIISTVLRFIWNIISTIFRKILSITQTIFGAVRRFISVVFHAIKNVVVNSVKAIFNGVKRWFTAVKNITHTIFSALKQFIYKIWTSIKNKVVSLAKALSNGVKNIFNSLSKVTRSIFNKLKSFMSNVWRNIKNTVIKLAKGLWNGVKATWNNLKKGTIKIIASVAVWLIKKWLSIKKNVVNTVKKLWSGVKKTWNSLKSGTIKIMASIAVWLIKKWIAIKKSVVNKAKGLWSGVKNTWNSLSRGTRNIFNRVKGFMSNTWRSIKNTTVNMAKGLWNSVRRTFNNMNGGLKNIIGKIKGHITGMVKAVKEGLNKLIGGVNWVADKIGMKRISTFKFHTGTESTHTQNLVTNGKLNQNTLATVGDKGKGNGPGGFRHETIIPPKGKPFITPAKDTTMPLSKGTRILNGAQTHSLLNQGYFSTGTIPKFASGTKKNMLEAMGDKAGKFFNSANKLSHSAMDNVGDKTKQAKEWGGEKLSQIKGAVGKGTKWLSDKVGDIADWVGKPGKLLNKVLEAFGVNMDAFGIAKSAEIPYNLMKAMFGKLKEAAKNLIDGWLEDEFSGGGGYNPYANNSKFKWVRGWTSSGHAGIDYAAPTGTPIPSPIDGKVIKSWFSPHGGGNETQVWDGSKYTHIFMHQVDGGRLVKNGDRVHQGEIIGKVGTTGNSTGPHLHWQVNKGKGYLNNHPDSVNPLTWAKQAAKAGGKSGGKQAPSKWRSTIVKAARKMKVNPTNAQINGIIAQIQRESGGDSGIIQSASLHDGNEGPNRARGLLQYVPSTFRAYAVKGHNNINSGYDQLLAFFNNSNWKNDIQYGRSGWGPRGSRRFATGGLIKNAGWYNIAEGGYPEWIIPTDPARRNDAMKMLALAAQDIDKKSSARGNKRPNSLPKPSGSNDNDVLLQMLQAQQQQIALLTQIVTSNQTIADKNFEPTIDKYTHEQQVFNSIDKYNRQKQRKSRFKPGEVT